MQIDITIEESQEETILVTHFKAGEDFWCDSYIDTGKYNERNTLEIKVLETIKEHIDIILDNIEDKGDI